MNLKKKLHFITNYIYKLAYLQMLIATICALYKFKYGIFYFKYDIL